MVSFSLRWKNCILRKKGGISRNGQPNRSVVGGLKVDAILSRRLLQPNSTHSRVSRVFQGREGSYSFPARQWRTAARCGGYRLPHCSNLALGRAGRCAWKKGENEGWTCFNGFDSAALLGATSDSERLLSAHRTFWNRAYFVEATAGDRDDAAAGRRRGSSVGGSTGSPWVLFSETHEMNSEMVKTCLVSERRPNRV